MTRLGAFLSGIPIAAMLAGTIAYAVGYRDGAAPIVHPSLAPSGTVVVAAPSADPDEAAHQLALRIKDEAVSKCELGGGHPAIGFGTTVICIKPQCVDWERDPGFQPFKFGGSK
jgi:hypothetical protein